MANNAYLFRTEHKAPIRAAVKAKMASTKWGTWANYIKETREDYELIRIRDDATGKRFILPIGVKDNPSFSKLKEVIQGATTGVTAVQILKKDLPEYFLDDTPTDYSIPL